jgi:hypothetical protein
MTAQLWRRPILLVSMIFAATGCAAPTTTTAEPIATTAKPTATTAEPIATTAKPTATPAIPLSAFLHREDTAYGAVPPGEPTGPYDELGPPTDDAFPRPCRSMPHPSDRQIVLRLGVGVYLNEYQPGGSASPQFVDQTITRYFDDGAQAYLGELRRAVANCPTVVRDGRTLRHHLLPAHGLGDEALVISRTVPVATSYDESAPTEDRTYVTVVLRVGSVVVVLHDLGWEGYPTPQEVMREVAGHAEVRVRAWLKSGLGER